MNLTTDAHRWTQIGGPSRAGARRSEERQLVGLETGAPAGPGGFIRLDPTGSECSIFFKPNPSQLITWGRWVANGRRGRERGRGGFFKKAIRLR